MIQAQTWRRRVQSGKCLRRKFSTSGKFSAQITRCYLELVARGDEALRIELDQFANQGASNVGTLTHKKIDVIANSLAISDFVLN